MSDWKCRSAIAALDMCFAGGAPYDGLLVRSKGRFVEAAHDTRQVDFQTRSSRAVESVCVLRMCLTSEDSHENDERDAGDDGPYGNEGELATLIALRASGARHVFHG